MRYITDENRCLGRLYGAHRVLLLLPSHYQLSSTASESSLAFHPRVCDTTITTYINKQVQGELDVQPL